MSAPFILNGNGYNLNQFGLNKAWDIYRVMLLEQSNATESYQTNYCIDNMNLTLKLWFTYVVKNKFIYINLNKYII